MSIYQAIQSAMHGQDPDKYVGLLHDDFQFVRHQSGTTMDKAAMADMIRGNGRPRRTDGSRSAVSL